MKGRLKIFGFILALAYISVLIYIVFFARRRNGLVWSFRLINITPFSNMLEPFLDKDVPINVGWTNILTNLFGNIIIFIPFPIILLLNFRLSTKTVIIAGILTSLSIEILQFIFRVGVPDVDDLMLNTLGILIGILIWKLAKPFILKAKIL